MTAECESSLARRDPHHQQPVQRQQHQQRNPDQRKRHAAHSQQGHHDVAVRVSLLPASAMLQTPPSLPLRTS